MNIVVLLKIVPDTETRFQINNEGTDVVWDDTIEWVLGPYDEYAIEEAIRIKEAHGGKVISVTIGRGKEEKSIRKAMAMGVDEGVLIENDELVTSDPTSIAKALAETVKSLNPDIILTGRMATDSSDSFVGPAVAELLNFPVVTEISSLEIADGVATAIRDASGRKEKFELKLPAVFTADKGLNEPRYPKLPMIMKAKRKPLDKKGDAGTPIIKNVNQLKVEFPPKKEAGSKIMGTVDEMVNQLVDGLANKEKVL